MRFAVGEKLTSSYCIAFIGGVLMVSSSVFAYVSMVPKGRFINQVFNNVTTTSGVKFGSNINPLNNNAAIDLYFDVYQPAGDTCSSRPCVVCMYGGGFTGGDRTGPGGGQEAQALARYGYVGVAPDYRKWGTENDAAHKIWPAGFVVTAQDARACIRYLRAHASTYRIDTARIAIVGCSSGAFIALNVAFMDKPSKIPSVVDTNIFGGIEGNSGTPGVSSAVCAAAGNSGAMLDTSWIQATSPPYAGYQSTPDGWGVPTDTGTPTSHWGPYFTYYGITPISARLTHVGLLSGTLVAAPNQHCPGGFADSAHMFLYNAICEVGRKSGTNANLALGKSALQSSTSGGMSASRAVDGVTDGIASNNGVSQTNPDAQAWWQVDLGSEKIIDSIRAFNRTDCCGDHETNYDIKFGEDGTNWETCSYERGTMKSPSTYRIRGGVLGRYVRLQLHGTNSLQLGEVQVWGRDSNDVTGALSYNNPYSSIGLNAEFPSVFVVKSDAGAIDLPREIQGAAGDVDVFDCAGKLVQKSVMKKGRVQGKDFKGVKNGIYLVRIRNRHAE